jgi:hypothetical protein
VVAFDRFLGALLFLFAGITEKITIRFFKLQLLEAMLNPRAITDHSILGIRRRATTPTSGLRDARNRDAVLVHLCADATNRTLLPLEPEVLRRCEASLKLNYLSQENRVYLESALHRALNVLTSLENMASDAPVAEPVPHRVYVAPLQLPSKPELAKVPKARLTMAQEKEAKATLSRIRDLEAQLAEERAVNEEDELALEELRGEAKEKAEALKARFDAVETRIEAARKGLDDLKEDQLQEIRSYGRPPALVRKILEAVLIALNIPKADDWAVMQVTVRDHDIVNRLRKVTPADDDVPASSLRRLKEIVGDPLFTADNARRTSVGAAALLTWVRAVQGYHEVAAGAQDLKAALDELEAEIKERADELKTGEETAVNLKEDVDTQRKAYESNYGKSALDAREAQARDDAAKAHEAATAAWQAECTRLKEEHRAKKSAAAEAARPTEPKVPKPLLAYTAARVEETKSRCVRLIEAIRTTLENLKGPPSQMIVVEKRVYPAPSPPRKVLLEHAWKERDVVERERADQRYLAIHTSAHKRKGVWAPAPGPSDAAARSAARAARSKSATASGSPASAHEPLQLQPGGTSLLLESTNAPTSVNYTAGPQYVDPTNAYQTYQQQPQQPWGAAPMYDMSTSLQQPQQFQQEGYAQPMTQWGGGAVDQSQQQYQWGGMQQQQPQQQPTMFQPQPQQQQQWSWGGSAPVMAQPQSSFW